MNGIGGSTAEHSDHELPGVRRLRPDDHFMILTDTEATPIQIGALISLQIPDSARGEVFERLRDHLLARLAATPLLVVRREAPDGYDSDVWVDVVDCDHDVHFQRVTTPLDRAGLEAAAAANAMLPLDPARPPFRVVVFEDTGAGTCAVQLAVHHAVADGVGFQTLLARLSDDQAPPPGPRRAGQPLEPAAWRAVAEARFAAEADRRATARARADEARAMLKSGALPKRTRTPVLGRSGPTSAERAYTRLTLDLDHVRSVAKRFDATINDLFLAIASGAVRSELLELEDLPDTPIVANSARSYRRPEHGAWGNRIVALHPHLATHLADPVERLAAIRSSMADEWVRTPWDEAMLDQPERPFGPRDRRARFAERAGEGDAVLPGNVSLSNVPGPPETRTYAGFRQLGNHPVPILGSGRFLNLTSRRNGPSLDIGVMADPTKLPDVHRVAARVLAALDSYAAS